MSGLVAGARRGLGATRREPSCWSRRRR